MSETDTDAPSPSEATPATTEATGPPGAAQLKQDVIAAIKTCYDPEIPIDIYELGLIYEIEVREANAVFIKMTLTSPMCPVAETLPPEVEEKVRGVPGGAGAELELVWEPAWSPEMMSEAARLELNM